MKKILLVDDHALTRKGLAQILNAASDLTVCDEQETAEGALRVLEGVDPDLVLAEIALPGMSGLELIGRIHAVKPGLPVIVVSRQEEALCAERALRAGARAFVTKLDAGNVIVKAIHRVLDGRFYLSETVADELLRALATSRHTLIQSPIEVLSEQEMEVFEQTGRGIATRDIAQSMGLSVKTVESYRSRIKEKLNIQTAADLMQQAVKWVDRKSLCVCYCWEKGCAEVDLLDQASEATR